MPILQGYFAHKKQPPALGRLSPGPYGDPRMTKPRALWWSLTTREMCFVSEAPL